MKIPAQEFLAAFEVCDLTPADPVLEASLYVRLTQSDKQLQLSLTGQLWTEARATASEGAGKWTAYIDRRALKAFLSTTNGNDIEVFHKDKLILKAGNRLEIALRPPISGYERWQPAKAFDLSDELKAIIAVGIKYLPGSVGSREVAAVNVRKDGIIATDTLFMFGIFGVAVPADCLLPTTLAKYLTEASGKLAVDGNGVGVALDNGYAYEPQISQLDKYPLKGCQSQLDGARKSPALATVNVADLLGALQAATPFLLDKAETGTLTAKESSLLLTVPLASGKFQQGIPTQAKPTLPETKWVFKRAVPFLEFISRLKDDAVIEIAKPAGSLVLRFIDGNKQYVLLSADV